MIKQTILILGYLVTFQAAQASIMCRDYNHVAAGDMQEKVAKVCGVPESKTVTEEQITNPLDVGQYVFQYTRDLMAGTMAPRVTVTVVKGKVHRIATDAGEVQSLDFCRGEVISVGDAEMKLLSFCPKPLSHNQGSISGEPVKVKVEVWVYKVYGNDVKMRFIEGVLTE